MAGTIFMYLILICWPTAVITFFLGIFIGFPYGKNGKDLMQEIRTWPEVFAAIRGKFGFRARLYGIVFLISLIAGTLGMGAFFIGGIFCS